MCIFDDPTISMLDAAILDAEAHRFVDAFSQERLDREGIVGSLRFLPADAAKLDALPDEERELIYEAAWATYRRPS